MSSRWTDRISQALGLRLAAWYLGIFLASTLLIGGLTYGLLAHAARKPRSRHHPVDAARIRDALSGRRPARAGARHRDRAAIGIARAVVRPAGRTVRGRAALFAAGNVGRVRSVGAARADRTRSGRRCERSDRNAVLEVATIDVGGGIGAAGRQDQRSAQPAAVELPARADARRRLRAA